MKHKAQQNGWHKSAIVSLGLCLLFMAVAAAGFASEGGEGAHHVDSAKQMKDFAWRVLDFAVLIAIAVWALKKANVKQSLADRRTAIDRSLAEAAEAKAAAELKFVEYNDKLAAANKEIDEIYAAIRTEGEAEKARIIAEAKVTAEKIREQAQQTAAQEVLKARTALRIEAARLAVELAEQNIQAHIRKDDQDRLVGEYLTKVVELH